MYTSNKLVPGVVTTTPEVTPFPKIWIGCLAVNYDKVFVCLYDMLEVVCSALLVPREATKDNNPFQFEGMTPNIWIEKNLRELLKASQTGTILEDIPSLMYTSNKLVPGVIDTIPSDNKTRGHTFSQDLDWLSCGER